MAACIWVQYDPATGLISATVTGDDQFPPPHPSQISVAAGTPVDALTQRVDITQSPPTLVAYTPPPPVTIPRIDFMLRFTQAERIAIRASTDPIVVDFLDLLTHATTVTLTDALVQQGVQYLTKTSPALLTADRATAILTP